MSEARKLKVFLCHASIDKPKIKDLYQYLQEHDIDVWLDSESLNPGQDWQLEIAKALDASDIVIVCLSKNSVNTAGYMQKEIVFALDKAQEKPEGRIFIIPAKLEECEVPNRLSRYQWVDLQQTGSYLRLMSSLKLHAEQLDQVSRITSIEVSYWPREIISRINKLTGGWSVFRSQDVITWIWVWLYTFWLLTPSLRWPFTSQEQAFSSIIMYLAGSLSIPLLIGLFTNTKNNQLWQERSMAPNWLIRLYTYQGAGIGFHLGYFAIFIVNIAIFYIGYYLGLESNTVLQRLLEAIEMSVLLIIGYLCAWLTPDNLWRAYKRLTLNDGAIFFVFFAMGPFWGIFFYYSYSLILNPVDGLIMFLLTASVAVGAMALQQRRTGTTIIPAHWYTIFYGSICSLYFLTITTTIFGVAAFEGLILTFGYLMAIKRIQFNVRGILSFIVVSSILAAVLDFNPWLGRALTVIVLFVWWRWDKKFLSFPLSFWAVIIAIAGCALMLQQKWLTDIQASIIFGLITLLLLLWESRLHHK